MTFRHSLSTTALITTLFASPSFADVTGQQVWDDWKSYLTGFGYEVSGTEQQSGGTLTVSDITMSITLPDEMGSMLMSMGEMSFQDNSDGTVSVLMADEMPVKLDMTADGERVSMTYTISQSGQSMVASGDPEDMTWTYDAAKLAVTVDELDVEGEDIPDNFMNITFAMDDVSSVTRVLEGELRKYSETVTAAALSFDVLFNVPENEGGGRVALNGKMDTLNGTFTSDVPKTNVGIDFQELLAKGFTFGGNLSYATSVANMDAQTPDGNAKAISQSGSGSLQVSMGASGLAYDVAQSDLSVTMESPDIPFPVALEMARSAFNLTMPVQAGDAEQDFALGFTMGEFSINDAIWNILDPAGQLPRDPATIALDLTGKAKMLVNIFDMEGQKRIEAGETPGEINALDINNIEVSAAGAKVTGVGGFTFDNSDLMSFGGVPKPTGALDVRVEGANGLMDKLVAMGLLPQEQAMGARMMMGMFGVPQGEDVLTSKIEINEQGHVLANGQRLQ